MRPASRRVPAVVAVAWTILVLAGCGAGHRLGEYDFRDRTLSVVDTGTPPPALLTGSFDVDATEDPVGAVLDAGSRAAKEVAARKARARLDSAARGVEPAEQMARRLLERSSRYLATRPVEDEREADFLLELDIREYGVDARGDRARLFVEAMAVLLDTESGHEIWRSEVQARDRLTPRVRGADPIPGDILTAGGLARISVEDFRRILEGLADFSADAVTEELREDLRDVRREGRRD